MNHHRAVVVPVALVALVALFALGCKKSNVEAPMETNGERKDGLQGLWAGEREFASGQPRELVVTVKQGAWTLQAGELSAPIERRDGAARASFEDGAAVRFLRLDVDSGNSNTSKIHGHWIQAPSTMIGYPTATPYVLKREASGWRGTLEPLADKVSLHVKITGDRDVGYRAFVREHGRNAGRFFGQMSVQLDGATATFKPERDGPPLTAELSGDRLTIAIERLGEPLLLTRRGRKSAASFYPRTEPAADYRYQPPLAAGDRWRVGNLAEAGFDVAALETLVREVIAVEPTSFHDPAIHSLLIARRGRLVLEEYFYGASATEPHDTRSAGKSFATTLVGIAADRKLLSPETTVATFMGSTAADSRKKVMKIEHLLTMSSGLECDDNDYDGSRGNEDRMQSQGDEPNWHRYAWQLPMVREPGAKGVYCSAGINLLGAAVTHATKQWIPDWFRETLAEPLHFGRYHFNLMPNGDGYLGGGIRLQPRDFAKLGQVFLDKGKWLGSSVVSEGWIEAATSPKSGINEPNDYGYGWWRIQYDVDGVKRDGFYASGNGGQLIIVVPSLETVIAFMAGNYGDYGTWRHFRDDLALRVLRAIG